MVCGVSVVATNLAYLVSACAGQVAVCVPYLAGCTSISRAARQLPAVYLFRATLIPVAPVMAAAWWLAGEWLDAGRGREAAARRWIVALGVAGALCLVLYATFLGTSGAAYELMRRYGVTLYFAFTALAQMILTACLGRRRRTGRPLAHIGSERFMTALAAVMLALGLTNIPLSNFMDADALENAIEWNFALAMMLWFGVLAREWRREGLVVRVYGPARSRPDGKET